MTTDVLAQADLVADLLADLADDGVAVRDAAVDAGALVRARDEAAREVEDIRVVVLDSEPDLGAEALANELVDQTGGTVMVFTPSTVAAASRTVSDAAVESALDAGSLADPVTGVGTFADDLAGGGIGAGTVLLLALLVVVPVAAVGRWWEGRRRRDRERGALEELLVPVRQALDVAGDEVLDLDGQTLVAGDEVDARFRALAAEYRMQRERATAAPGDRDVAAQWRQQAEELVRDLGEVRDAVDRAARPGTSGG